MNAMYRVFAINRIDGRYVEGRHVAVCDNLDSATLQASFVSPKNDPSEVAIVFIRSDGMDGGAVPREMYTGSNGEWLEKPEVDTNERIWMNAHQKAT